VGLPRKIVLSIPLGFVLLSFLPPTRVLGQTGPQPAPGPTPSYPATEQGRCVRDYFEAVNSGDEKRLRSLFERCYSETARKTRSVDDRLQTARDMVRDLGTLTPDRILEASQGLISVLVRAGNGELLEFGFESEPAPGRGFRGVKVDQTVEPDPNQPTGALSLTQATEEIDRHLTTRAGEDAFAGVALVAKDDAVVFHKAYGPAHRGLGVANRPDTRFNLGSINKLFTKVAIGQLLDQGRLALDDRLGRILPDYPNPDAREKVTVRQLLEMRSGIGDFFGERFMALPKDRLRKNADFLPLFADQPLLFEPGSERRYSNGGYIVLGAIVEKVSGQDYYDYLRQNVFARAGMTDTDSYQADAIVANLAEGYTRRGGGPERPDAPLTANTYSRPARGSAAGGGYSTGLDLLRFSQALAQGKLLSPGWSAWVLGAAPPTPGAPASADPPPRRGEIGAAGGAPGINALLEADFEGGWTVIVLTNLDPPAAERAGQRIRSLLRRASAR